MPRTAGAARRRPPLLPFVAITWLSVIVLIPLAAVVAKSTERGFDGFWGTVSSPQAVAALKLTVGAAVIVALVNAVAGTGLALGRALGEFGAVVLISGNLPYKTEVAPVFITSQIESGNTAGAAAIAVVLLVASVLLLSAFALLGRRWSR